MTVTDTPTVGPTSTPTYCYQAPYSPGCDLLTTFDNLSADQVKAYAVTLTSSAQLTELGAFYRTVFTPAAGPATVKMAVYSVSGGVATLVPGSSGDITFYAGGNTPYSWVSFPVSGSLSAGEYLLVFQQVAGFAGFEFGGSCAVSGGDVYTAVTVQDIATSFSPWLLPTPTPAVYGPSYLKYCPN